MLALCLTALAAVPIGNVIAAQAFFTAVTVFSGFNILGAVKSAQLVTISGERLPSTRDFRPPDSTPTS